MYVAVYRGPLTLVVRDCYKLQMSCGCKHYLCPSRTFRTIWWSPGCRCAFVPCRFAAAATADAARAAPSAVGPSPPRLAHSAPSASENEPTTV